MKGMEFKTILALIIVVAFIFIAVLIAIGPSLNIGDVMGSDISFTEFCYHWGIRGYSNFNEPIMVGNEPVGSPAEICGRRGFLDQDTCINSCKGA